MNVNLSTTWTYNPSDTPPNNPSMYFPEVNQTSASLWWGESLIAWYYLAFINAMTVSAQSSGFYNGYIVINRPLGLATTEAEIKSLDFFSANCYSFQFSKDADYQDVWCGGYFSIGALANRDIMSGIWIRLTAS